MEEVRGRGRGSYIFGRSVHNIRIERLWVDWTTGVGKKWATFFYELEYEEGLYTDNTAHLQSPREMFMFGLLEDGPRGIGRLATPLPAAEDEASDVSQLGIDWEAQAAPALNNALDWDPENPFAAESTPDNLSEVLVEPPNSPFTADEINWLDAELARSADVTSRDMAVRKAVWREALRLCNQLYE
ncbi:hypothetical protein C8R45DRAFT_1057464 [Mycena sanguinolenta]|nr:hypothetical protein C8R45DRAFT_1057464 [Mycena sanguinolenta]